MPFRKYITFKINLCFRSTRERCAKFSCIILRSIEDNLSGCDATKENRFAAYPEKK